MTARIPFLHQRMPFFGLFVAASAGIWIASAISVGSCIFVVGCIGALAGWIFRRRSAWILLAVAAAFGAVHTWQTRESTSAALENLVGTEKILVTAIGVVSSEPTSFGGRWHFTVRAENLTFAGASFDPHAEILIVTKDDMPALGDIVRVVGSLRPIPASRNPGQFDAKSWMALRGITCEMEVAAPADLIVLAEARKFFLLRIAQRCRGWMEAALRNGISDDPIVCDLLAGMVLGVTTSIPDFLQQQFRNTGTFHLFSVSGLHVGMIGVLLWQALKIAGISRRTAVVIIIPALFFYVLVTGWKSASVRAAMMSAIFLVGITASRQPIPFNSLCAAGFLILAQWTNELFNPGFQFSFLVVSAILLLARPLHNEIRSHCHPDSFIPRQLWHPSQKWAATFSEKGGGLIAVSFAAWIASLPLTLVYFHLVSLSALPANILIVPLAFVIMATAAIALVGGAFWSALGVVFNNANWFFTKLLLIVVQAAAALPGSFFYVGMPERAPTALTVFDFGSGGATGVECGERVWLVDCGSSWHLDSVLMPWLHSRGKASPDGIVLTHGDARHIGAAWELVQRARPNIIVESSLDDRSSQRGKLHRELEAIEIPKSIYRAGDHIAISSDLSMKVLHPPSGLIRNEADDKVIILRLDASGKRILMLSDAGPPTQQWLLENMADEIAADILIQGRHRSGLPMDSAFLDAVNPKLIICTVSTFPENEPVDENWEASLKAKGVRLFRQDQTGAVKIEIFQKYFKATGFVNHAEYLSR